LPHFSLENVGPDIPILKVAQAEYAKPQIDDVKVIF
jgi:hypothetical protein